MYTRKDRKGDDCGMVPNRRTGRIQSKRFGTPRRGQSVPRAAFGVAMLTLLRLPFQSGLRVALGPASRRWRRYADMG
jgi:hypothetical protein